jgi:hypothetical protein
MIKKSAVAIFAVLFFITSSSKANEGMWLPFMINDALYEEMHGMGLELSREQIFSFNDSSLKDAIVSFGGGCTAEIISSKGLLLTNHHCGYGRIQYHSTPENDYLAKGFFAMSLEEELPNPDLFVQFLVSVTDVTAEVARELNESMNLKTRDEAVKKVSEKLVENAIRNTHYNANVRAMYAGNEYYLFVYERFNDVRLVGTPPSSIGKFGGDTDNWMWPRHTGDFALFRVYTAPDGSPADYNAANVPLVPRHHLPISLKGVQEGDFTMILGFPGSTDRYLTSLGIDFKLENELPVRIDIRRQKLDIIEAEMAASTENRIKYSSKQSGIANYWKNFIGMSNALKKNNVASEKRITEEAFKNWVMQDEARMKEYGNVLQMFTDAYEGLKGFKSANYVFVETIPTGPGLAMLANGFSNLEKFLAENAPADSIKAEVARIQRLKIRFFRSYSKDVDQKLWAAMMKTYSELTPTHLQPAVFNEINKKYKGNFNRFAADVYKKSFFADSVSLNKFLENPSLRNLQKDMVYKTIRSLYINSDKVKEQMSVYDEQLSVARRLFIKGLREMDPDGMFYPDANSTMRFTYGSVRGYQPADGITYHYYTTLDGVMDKENPDHHEFVMCERLRKVYQEKDFGIYGHNGTVVVNFISDNDITGGNSGSGVLDGQGNLIGLAFDGNWEAMSGDILFEKNMQRCINMDARYLLFLIDKCAGAKHLIDEMTIVL